VHVTAGVALQEEVNKRSNDDEAKKWMRRLIMG